MTNVLHIHIVRRLQEFRRNFTKSTNKNICAQQCWALRKGKQYIIQACARPSHSVFTSSLELKSSAVLSPGGTCIQPRTAMTPAVCPSKPSPLFVFLLLLQGEMIVFTRSAASPLHWDYIVVGAGPSGLQMAYFLQTSRRQYIVLERANVSGRRKCPGISFPLSPSISPQR